MSFGGAVGAMITSLKNNKRNRKSAFKKLENYSESNDKLHFEKKASKKELKQLREKIKNQNRKTAVITIIIFLTVILLFAYFLGFFKH